MATPSGANRLREAGKPPRLARLCPVLACEPDDLLDLQRETTQVEQRRIWPWHHQEICVTGIGRVPAGNRTGHAHLAQATARRRCEGAVGLEPTIRGALADPA